MNVAIVGGGITGLATAYLLRQREVPVDLFEARSQLGGLAGSTGRDGFAFDFGPHEIRSCNPAVLDLLHATCGDDLLTIEKRVAQHYQNRLYRYPFRVADVLRQAPVGICARALVDVAKARLRARFVRSRDDSFESWTKNRFGQTLYDLYFGPYTRKVWGVDPASLAVDAAEQRIPVTSFAHLVLQSLAFQFLGYEDHQRTHSEAQHTFFYTRGGIGTLHKRLLEQAQAAGVRVHTGRRLAALEHGRGYRLGFADGTVAGRYTHVFSTIPLPTLLSAALGADGPALLDANPLSYRGMVFLFLRVDRPAVQDNHWVYYPELDIPFQRLTEFGHFGADMCPPGKTGLAIEVAADPGDSVWEADDSIIAKRGIQALERWAGLDPSTVLGWDVVRRAHVYPVLLRGADEHRRTLLEALEPYPNLITLGRQGLFRYCNIDECIEMALDVVPRAIDGQERVRCEADPRWQGVLHDAAQEGKLERDLAALSLVANEPSLPQSARRASGDL